MVYERQIDKRKRPNGSVINVDWVKKTNKQYNRKPVKIKKT